jgi:glycosyltransferase involved in cell wall biosynthesis
MRTERKIAFFLPGLYGGGAERIILNLAREFCANGYPVDLVLAEEQGPLLSIIPAGVNLVSLSRNPSARFRTLRILPALVRYLRSAEPAWLVSAVHANLVALMANRLAKSMTRVMITEHNTFSRQIGTLSAAARTATVLLSRTLYPKADAIVAVSEGVAQDLVRFLSLPADRIRVIYNPIITDAMSSLSREPLDHPWFNGGDAPVIVSIGRLTAAKDYPTLIAAFKTVRNRLPLKLMILGEGEERPKLEALIDREGLNGDVQLPGFVPNPLPYLRQAALFVLPSRWEGLPTVLVEALFCGTPIIATDCPSGPREILNNGDYGDLVPVGDPAALAERIYERVLNPRGAAPPASWMSYSSESIARRYFDLMAGSTTCMLP